MNPEFSRNLRLLTDHYRSVAEVCRRIGLNRSQFNKYLSGRSTPSRHVFKTVCDFFGVEEYEILLPHQEFQKIVAVKPNDASNADLRRPYVSYLDRLVGLSRGDLLAYEGFFFEYSMSMARPGLVLRSLLKLSGEAGMMTYRRIENLSLRPERRMKCKYQGMAFYLNDRIFLVDHDSMTGNEISHTILYPNYQHRLTRLTGLKLGVSTSHHREPLCARVVLESLGRSISVKEALGACGLFEPGNPEIDPEIRSMIANTIEYGAHHFRVFTQA